MMNANRFQLSGKNVLVTGATGILGSHLIPALASHGANVALCDVHLDKAQQLAQAISDKYAVVAKAFTVDVTDPQSFAQLKQSVFHQFKTIDVLINAAVVKSKNFFEPFEEFPLEDWQQVMSVNSTGVMLGCQTFGAEMAKHKNGSIINVLSIYGIVAPDQRIYEGSEHEGRAINTPAVYSASKAAVWGLTKYLATYWAQAGVRVNAVTPGGIFSGQNDTFVKKYSQRVPLGRMAHADEICSAILFLASDAASYVTGQNVVVDGGLTAW